MAWAPDSSPDELKKAAAIFDRPRVQALCDELITHLDGRDTPYPNPEARRILSVLRGKRYFAEMQRVAEAMTDAGSPDPQLQRQLAQALIEQRNFTGARALLTELVDRIEADGDERAEAEGLLGRLNKQQYVDEPSRSVGRRARFLRDAISAYYPAYLSDPVAHYWHGINVVALAARARRDAVDAGTQIDGRALADEILQRIAAADAAGGADTWQLATAMEASVALGQTDAALAWLVKYVQVDYTDAFELASTLRQLKEIWQLTGTEPPGSHLLPVLQAELLKREGGMLQSGTEDLQGGSLAKLGEKELQRILGQTGVVTFKWYLRGLSRCVGVAKITTEDDEPVGTGFLVRGKDLAPGLGDEVLLLTNAHVIDDKAAGQNCLRSTQAVITFEAKSRDAVTRGVSVVWTSPVSQLDATLVRLKDVPVEPDPFPLAAELPLVDGKQRVYVIGHPGGRSLSLSLQDNLLLGCENPLLHYRAPTEQGSSGSPVFNQQWDLVALHHAGSSSMRRLSGQEGTYAANEGIWIQAIRKQLAASFV